ncbi:hypothetical protein ACWCXB_23805 [Streptomyces sp. NPDC001514]
MTAPAPAPEKASTRICRYQPVPGARQLSWEQAAGRACVTCGRPLTTGAVYMGWARGRDGAHSLDCEVWACP